jgi:hypothetical protein
MLFLSLYNARAICAFFGVSAFGRPPFRPRARAALSPACVRSRMISRSNSASAPKIWNISFPPDVVVSIASVIDLKPIPRLLRPVIVSMRCLRERPSRSSLHTTRVSPSRRWLRASSSPVRSALAPDAVSVKTLSQPALAKASFWRSRV